MERPRSCGSSRLRDLFMTNYFVGQRIRRLLTILLHRRKPLRNSLLQHLLRGSELVVGWHPQEEVGRPVVVFEGLVLAVLREPQKVEV